MLVSRASHFALRYDVFVVPPPVALPEVAALGDCLGELAGDTAPAGARDLPASSVLRPAVVLPPDVTPRSRSREPPALLEDVERLLFRGRPVAVSDACSIKFRMPLRFSCVPETLRAPPVAPAVPRPLPIDAIRS